MSRRDALASPARGRTHQHGGLLASCGIAGSRIDEAPRRLGDVEGTDAD